MFDDVFGMLINMVSIIGIVFAAIRVYIQVSNKTELEQILTPKNRLIWDIFLEYSFISVTFTLVATGLSYLIAMDYNFNRHLPFLTSVMLLMRVLFLVTFIVLSIIWIVESMFKIFQDNVKIKKVANVLLAICYFLFSFIVFSTLTLSIHHVSQQNKTVLEIFLILTVYIICCSILFLIKFLFTRYMQQFFNLKNAREHNYKLSIINENNIQQTLNKLYLVYSLDAERQVLSENPQTKKENFFPIYLYYIKDNRLLKYEK